MSRLPGSWRLPIRIVSRLSPGRKRDFRYGRLSSDSRSGKGYGESMPAPRDDEDVEPPEDASASRARQWCRAALALGFLFASLPLTGKLFLGSWRFDGERTIDSRHFRHALRRRASARAASSRGVRGIAWRGLKVGAGERFARLRNSRAGARLNPARHRRSACGEDQRATARAPSSHCAGVRRRMINALHGCRVLRYGRGESNLDP